MSKYAPLRDYLRNQRQARLRMTFSEIEKILGFRLPKSARLYPAWWANQEPPSSQSSSWREAGWITEQVNIPSSSVTFLKILGQSPTARPASPSGKRRNSASGPQPATGQATASPYDLPGKGDAAEVSYRWAYGGELHMGDAGKLTHDIKSGLPALYRIRLTGAGGERRYVGETSNLSRRMYQYCNPGPTQQTNIRLNGIFVQHICYGGRIHVDLVQDGAQFCLNGAARAPDLASKFDRRLLENAAILIELANGSNLLNS